MSALPADTDELGCATSPSNGDGPVQEAQHVSAPARLATPRQDRTVELEEWSQPRVNRYRYLATVFGLGVMGMNDACLGALLPYVRTTVHGLLPK